LAGTKQVVKVEKSKDNGERVSGEIIVDLRPLHLAAREH
jgi:hypothetical protein